MTQNFSRPEGGGEIAQPDDSGRSTRHPNTRVLLVEDDEAVASGLEALLQIEGFQVHIARSGADAIRYLETAKPDVVVLDVGLPDMDGTVVYKQIVEHYPDLPVIFSTGDAAQLHVLGTDRPVLYLLKPFDTDVLIATINNALSLG